MLPRHTRHSHSRLSLLVALDLDPHHHLLIRVDAVDVGERVVALGRESAFGVLGADDGEVATEGFLDFLIEVVSSQISLSDRYGE